MTCLRFLSPISRRLAISLLFLASVALSPATALGQSPTATLSGQVTDERDAVIPGATVTVVNTATGARRETTTNGEGYFVVPLLSPSTYVINVQQKGFAPIEVKNVVLNVGDKKALQIQLKAGDINATVQVVNDAPLINESPSVGTVVDRQFVEKLPLNGRSFNTLLQLTPGVVIAPTSGQTFGPGVAPGQFSIAGQRSDANNFTVDGVSANFGVTANGQLGQSGTGTAQAFSALGGTSSLVSVEALQEFRIETSSFAPEFGRSPGGQVMLTTRSGTNSFHGGGYEYFRNNVMDANDWFANGLSGSPHAPERHNDFGGFLGGPILKGRTFFFFSYEGARLRLPKTTSGILVPSNAVRASAASSPTIAAFLNAFPVPNGPVSAAGDRAQYSASFSDSATLNATSIRLDHTFNSKFSVFGRYNYAPSQFGGPVVQTVWEQMNPVNTQTLTAGVNMLLSNRLTNVFTGNYSSQSAGSVYSQSSLGGAVPLTPSALLGNLDSSNLAVFALLGGASLRFGPQVANKTRQINFVDNLSITSGTHQIRIGGDYRDIFLDVQGSQHLAQIAVSSFTNFVATGQAFFTVATSQNKSYLSSQAFSLYGQDTWRVSPRLTMTYGLRWELDPAPSPRNGTTLAAWQNVNNPTAIALAPQGTPVWATRYANFAPRLGIAYNLTTRGDLVFRAGGGVFYDLGQGQAASLGNFFPNAATGSLSFNVAVPVTDWTPFLPSLSRNPPYPNVFAFSPDLKLPRSYQWNAAVEKSFGGKQAVSLTYVGQAGRNLLRQEDIPQPNASFKPGTHFTLTKNNARSNYNALQVQYRRPLSNRLQALLNYTWSRSLDSASDDLAEEVSNTVISEANDYSFSDFDVRHSFSGAVTYDIPAAAKAGPLAAITKGWSVDAVIVARTSFPFSVFVNAFNISGAAARANVVAGQPLTVTGTQCATTFQALGVLSAGQLCPGGKGVNPNAFSNPPTGQQGNQARNSLRLFGLKQVDLSVARRFAITESIGLQFRADAFNVFNHPNFTNPNPGTGVNLLFLSRSMLNNGLGGLNPLFQEGGPRSIQLSLKLTF